MSNDDEVRKYFANTVDLDLLRLVCGEEIGNGIARTVYGCRLREDLVVKIETAGTSFQNIMEWEFWNTWSYDKDVSRWLAPCEMISPCGAILLQHRTSPIPPEKFPSKMPKFLTDMKKSNYGLLKGKVVCHDYGMVVNNVTTTQRKADWWT